MPLLRILRGSCKGPQSLLAACALVDAENEEVRALKSQVDLLRSEEAAAEASLEEEVKKARRVRRVVRHRVRSLGGQGAAAFPSSSSWPPRSVSLEKRVSSLRGFC